ncbi:ABC transporter substrate-binding protein [Aeromicrobium choanae]|uniref:ABC-type nitrate/sulfonate/bicarbonate transport system, substrate-binding protein n=1 Tax=Aeromicrobium choanae TaxID=1736691 RepID=A0A1T4YQ80_9ACTN|nr:ABC transporter substrate-binding protein [Aeromicrobium choanae]SKB03823.1 ABC-type nitrate/sulfonate/bicarbonate transport system, substrate-binding protein [Aeromicrobium choanae]
MNHVRSPRFTRTLVVTVAAALAAMGLGACGSAGADSGKEVTTIRYQSYAGAVDAFLLADALGEFEGLTLKRVGDITGGPQALQALVSDQTDVGGSAFYGAIAQLVATGAPIKAVIPFYGSNETTNSSVSVLEKSDIRTARDLVGKKIAVNTLGANQEAVLDTWFDQEGLSKAEQDKITLVPLPPLNTPEALGSGKVDAAVLSFTGKKQTEAQYALRTLVRDIDVVGEPYAGGGITLREEFIAKNPKTSRQIVEGVAAAIEFLETHDKQEVFDVYFPYLEEEGYGDYIEPIRTNFPGTLGIDAKPVIKDEDIQRWVDWLDSRGDIDAEDIDVKDVYTNELNPNA